MCDYSLMSLRNRLAKCGEELVTHKFEFGTTGLAAASEVGEMNCRKAEPVHGFRAKLARFLNPPADPCTVICIPPGAHLLLRDIPEKLQRKMKLEGPIQEVVITQLDRREYRDAIRFANGRELSLQKLHEGLRVSVLALSSEPMETLEEELTSVEEILSN
jgi:hypothetical protein